MKKLLKALRRLVFGAVAALILVIALSGLTYQHQKVIQINVSKVLNIRTVTTLTRGTLVPWTKGVDHGNGYMTMAACLFNNEADSQALPDQPLITANQSHPEILLHYNNHDGRNNQTTCIADTGTLEINVPRHYYTDLYFSLTSAYGTTNLQFELVYKDGVETREFKLPDWWNNIPEYDPDICYVVHNLGKWTKDSKLAEKDHHNIDALNIHPNPNRQLELVKLKKMPGGYLVFWALTGVIK